MSQYLRAQTFNANAAIYDDVRPGYPEQLYRDIQEYAGITDNTQILEIGAGNGIATQEMGMYWDAHITALEPGADLLAIARERCRQHQKTHLIQSTFEDYTAVEQFDLIVSATAFHWIDPTIKFAKTAVLLKDSGFLAVFWNNYARDEADIFDEIARAYTRLHPTERGNTEDVRHITQEKINRRLGEFQHTPLFQHVVHHEYTNSVPFTSDSYLKLLKTFSPNAIQPLHTMQPFYDEIERIVLRHNNVIHQPILVTLDILRRIS